MDQIVRVLSSASSGRSAETNQVEVRKLKRIRLVSLLLGVLALTGCSKKLDESRAVKLAQTFVDSQNGGIVTTSASELTSQLDSEILEPLQMPGMRRLINKGWIEERKIQVPYPNFSGKFSGTLGNPSEAAFAVKYTFEFQTTGASKPPRVQGSYKDCIQVTMCWGGSIDGIVRRNGPSTLTLRQAIRGPSDNPKERTLVASLVRGQPDVIDGSLIEGGPGRPLRLEGQTTGPDIQQEAFTYIRTGSFPKDILDGSSLRLGHLEIDSCTGLLLGSETTARARCLAHVKLSSEAGVFLEGADTKGPLKVTFGKQPDGGWVATSVEYYAPQYSLSR